MTSNKNQQQQQKKNSSTAKTISKLVPHNNSKINTKYKIFFPPKFFRQVGVHRRGGNFPSTPPTVRPTIPQWHFRSKRSSNYRHRPGFRGIIPLQGTGEGLCEPIRPSEHTWSLPTAPIQRAALGNRTRQVGSLPAE